MTLSLFFIVILTIGAAAYALKVDYHPGVALLAAVVITLAATIKLILKDNNTNHAP